MIHLASAVGEIGWSDVGRAAAKKITAAALTVVIVPAVFVGLVVALALGIDPRKGQR